MPEPIDLLARPTWDHLDARLRDAVARNPSSAPLVEVIRAPARTLELLWRDAVPALRGDPLAAERLGVTLQAASGAAALVAVAAAALEQSPGDPDEHCPGLVNLRALAILVAAAFRTRSPAQAHYATLVIGGLALQCGPAELLARLEPYGASAEAYDNLIQLSVPPIVAAGVASRVHLRGHARDPVELARWRCIFEVIDRDLPLPDEGDPTEPEPGPQPLPQPEPDPIILRPSVAVAVAVAAAAPRSFMSTGSRYAIAHADGIDRVRLAEDGKLELLGSFGWLGGGEASPPGLDAERHAVVGVTTAQAVEVGFDVEAAPDRIRARFSSDLAWVGFVDRAWIRRANASRAAIRQMLAAIDQIPCVARAPGRVPGDLLPDYPEDAWPIAEAPPRTATNQLAAALAPAATGADASRASPGRITVVAVRVAAVDGPPPPPLDEIAQLLRAIGHRLGVGIDVVALPWVEDAAAVVSSPPEGDDDPRVAGLLEALARAAARTPGREAALWIAIVPGQAAVAVASTADGAAGVGVATCAGLPCCVAQLLDPPEPAAAAAPPPPVAAGRLRVPACRAVERRSPATRVRPPAARLRLIGRLAGTSLELLEPPREEARAAGPGAPEDTGVVAVALDRRGAELVRAPIRGHRAAGPATFAALIPVSPEVELVELRRGHLVLARVERALDPPAPARLAVGPGEAPGLVDATWTAPSSARPATLTLEVSAAGGQGADDWVPIAELHACAARARLPLWRLGGAARVRVVACDGWNAVAGDPVSLSQETRFGPCAIRRVNERTLWAELPGDLAFAWHTQVSHAARGRRLDLELASGGEVQLSVVDDDRPFLTDALELEHRDVYRRP